MPVFFDDGELCHIHLLEAEGAVPPADPFADLNRMGSAIDDQTPAAERAAAANEERATEFAETVSPPTSRPATTRTRSNPKE